MRRTYWFDKNGNSHEVPRRVGPPPPQKAPSIHADTIPPRYCDATGKTYESRSQLYADLKDSGFEPVPADFKVREVEHISSEEEIERSLLETANELYWNGNGVLDESEVHTCKEIDEHIKRGN